jgi:UDP-N-acetylmuramoylalanine--D-glutamate ligase
MAMNPYPLLKDYFELEPQVSRIWVVGLGATGVSVAYYLRLLKFTFTLVDSRADLPVLSQLNRDMADVRVIAGGYQPSDFDGATHIIVSPGVTLDDPSIQSALAKGARLVSDIDLFACSVAAPIIGITGSNGKSTVTTLLGEMAKAAGKKVVIGGNIGIAALDLLHTETEAELYILELSSFQLERLSVLNAAAATVLNITPDHLDRHADMALYARAKARVFNGDGIQVLNADDSAVMAMQKPGRQVITFSLKQQADFYLQLYQNGSGHEYLMHDSQRLLAASEIPLEGRHNIANALAALALGSALNLDTNAMIAALKVFKGLDHRMQRVADINGITWINDSKATNVGSCIAALEGFSRPVVLIAGGDAKGAEMHALKEAVQAKAKSVVLIGKDAGLIEQALSGCVPVHFAGTMIDAVAVASRLADKGDTVLLSPACASLDQYQSYKDRGEQFTRAVLQGAA